MFSVESQLELLKSTKGRLAQPLQITLRGYDQEKELVAAPAQFKDVPPIAVGRVVGFCPTFRDLVLLKREKVKEKDDETWPREAGRLIEKVLGHAFEHHAAKTKAAPLCDSVEQIAQAAYARVSEFSEDKAAAKKFAKLAGMVKENPFHFENEKLQGLLIDAVAIDLFHQQGALNYERSPNTPSERAVNGLVMNPQLTPAAHMKLSRAAPDFHVIKHKAIGDIKTGAWTDDYYLTAAGYALAYESEHGTDIDLGVIYLVDVDPVIIGHARVIIFSLTDDVRRRFLDRRNTALAALLGEGLPKRLTKAQEADYCDRCGFRKECFERDPVPP